MSTTRSREASKRATRQALLEAGLAEVVERGLDTPSLDAICARAGFTRGAFYVHFENREDFLNQLMDWVFGNFLETIVAAESGESSLRDVVARFLDALGRGQLPMSEWGVRFPQLLAAADRLPQIRDRFLVIAREAIERVSKCALEGQQRGDTRTDVDARILATLLVSAAIGGMALRDSGVLLDLEPLRQAVLRLVEG